MKKLMILLVALAGFSVDVLPRVAQKRKVSTAQAHKKAPRGKINVASTSSPIKQALLEKYQGKLNGIEQLARATNDIDSIASVGVIKQKIDAIANEVVDVANVDMPALEADIETMLHSALTTIFKQSIDLASKTYIHEASNSLFAISPWNKKIIWNKPQTHVLMLTWIPAAYKKTYEDKLASPMKITWDAWVTAVPEIKEFAQNYVLNNKNGFNLTDRIEQFLGLIPSKPPYATSQNKLFVEMWVRPEDLFRPCLDAEIGDKECMIDPHESDLQKLPVGYRDMSKLVTMTPEHKAWFDKEKKGKYEGQWAMPWTRFGYTYDWGSLKKATGKRAAQGGSEYLIKKDSNVIIESIIPTDEYPNAPEPTSGYIYQE